MIIGESHVESNNKIVCVTGLCGAGKSVVSDYFVNKYNFLFVRFGQITLDEIKRRQIELNEVNERKIREEFREKYGMSAYALLNLDRLDELSRQGNVVADGLYSFAEYKVLIDHFQDRMKVVAVFAPPQLRYERISRRVAEISDITLRNRPFSAEEAKSRDFSEIEKLDKGGTIAMADYTVLNTKGRTYLFGQLDRISREIMNI